MTCKVVKTTEFDLLLRATTMYNVVRQKSVGKNLSDIFEIKKSDEN